MQKLVSMIAEDTLTFIKAKEDFKKTLSFSGVLYRFVNELRTVLVRFLKNDDS